MCPFEYFRKKNQQRRYFHNLKIFFNMKTICQDFIIDDELNVSVHLYIFTCFVT